MGEAGTADPVFGRLLTAMVTPFATDGSIDHDAAGRLARHLITEQRHDGLVINGTTGESPTTSEREKTDLLRTVRAAVGPDVPLVAGVGSFDTAHTIEVAAQAAEAGASGLLVVTPYYSKPPQTGVEAHFRAVADAATLPILLYDIPHRTGTPIAEATLCALAEHPRIVGVKDAKGDPASSGRVMAATDLAYYSGEDNLTLPLLSLGAVGVVGTSTHFTGAATADMIEAAVAGDYSRALAIHRAIEPAYTGVFATQGCLLVKAAFAARGMFGGTVRLPLVPAEPEQAERFLQLLDACGL